MKGSDKAGMKPSVYRSDIDGLRAIAVIAVIINHFDKRLLPGGFLGVDLFFVISGYVITASLVRNRVENLWSFLIGFYMRRIRRLVPALASMVAVVSVLICLVNPNPGLSLQTGLASLIGFSNLLLYKLKTDYFAGSTELNVFTHTWSLGVEEQFYLLFPILFWVSGYGSSQQKSGRNLFTQVMAWLALASLLCFVWLKISRPDAAFFLLPSRFWEMAVGSILFAHQFKFQSRLWASTSAWLSLMTIIVCFFVPARSSLFSTPLIVLALVALIGSLPAQQRLSRTLSEAQLAGVGMISYSLYLWHWPVLALSRWTIGIHWWSIPFQILLIYGLAQASYNWIEKPLRYASWTARPAPSFLLGILFITSATAVLTLLALPLKGKMFIGKQNKIKNEYLSLVEPTISICNFFETPSVVGVIPSSCGFPAQPGRPTVYLLGDSHIHQFRSAIGAYARQKGYGLTGVWGNACPFPALPKYAYPGNERKIDCIRRVLKIERLIFATVRKGDIVFIGDYLTSYFNEISQATQQDRALLEYSARLRSTADQLIDRGATVILYMNAPRFPGLEGMSEGFCYPQWFKPSLSHACVVQADSFLHKRQQEFGWIHQWADGKRRLGWDGVDSATCDHQVCRATHYKDEAHFLDYYSSYIFRKFIALHPDLFSMPASGSSPSRTTASR